MDILVRQSILRGIPLLEAVPHDGARHPLVLLFHGYTSRKEFVLLQGYALATAGFSVAMPDAWGHGERARPGYCDFLDAIERTTEEIPGLLAALADRPGMDTARAGLAGISMGGCITFAYLAAGGAGIAAAAPLIGSPDWVSILETSEAMAHVTQPGAVAAGIDLPAYRARALRDQPCARLPEFPAVPLLVQNGEADTLIPAGPVRAFCETLAARAPGQDRVRFIGYPGVGHADTVEMNLAVAAWFRAHLLVPA
jgi:uncharacterized protein